MKKGQALITLLIFTAMAVTVTTAAVTVTIINSQATTKFSQGEEAMHVAEAGVENGILRLLRNRSYSGETLTVGGGSATITVSGLGTVTITSVGSSGDFKRTIQVVGTLANNIYSITSWNEID